ncbi:hypothetical protein Sjap_005276 [Stephania japonica]|uniref:Uncharacterized protein n=1 Tax=Stephania japonica TaxID=461633 RepID=A0AAP0PHQ2_9MAGN
MTASSALVFAKIAPPKRPPTAKPNPSPKSLFLHLNRNPNFTAPKSLSPGLLRTNCTANGGFSSSNLGKLFVASDPLSSVVESSAVSLFLADVDAESVFVVTPPRKLQQDKLATVRLFKENTPSADMCGWMKKMMADSSGVTE